MKKLIILLILIFFGNENFAFDIFYPQKTNVIINAKSTFFIGSSEKPLKINGQEIRLHPSGAFAHVVQLKSGINTFVITSDTERKIYIIVKPDIKPLFKTSHQFVQYKEKRSFYVTNEGAPLRSEAIDSGINRISHLQRNVNLTVDGEKDGFYRVVLDKDNHAWISKSDVKLFSGSTNAFANLSGYDYEDSSDYFTFIFHLDKRVPFEISETDPMVLKLYNIKGQGTYIMAFPVRETMNEKNLSGYSGEYIGNDFIWKIRKPLNINSSKPLKNIPIALDAGHGGDEYGAIGCLGHKEKDVVLSFSKLLETELKKRGAKVIMTRTNDSYKSLKDRVDTANAQNAVILLSIHGNALPDGLDPNKHSGTSIYYYYKQAEPLARELMSSITKQTAQNNDGIRQASLALIRNTNALSLLIETGYLINPDDNAKLINPDFQKLYAKALADALENYFKRQ